MGDGRQAKAFAALAFILGALFWTTALPAQAPDTPSARVLQAWDSLLADAPAAARLPEPVPDPARDFLDHLFFESSTSYQRYSTSFTGLPTATGIINAPLTGIFNPNGLAYPPAFQPAANRVYAFVDWGTRGWLSDRLNTHFAFRYAQDVSRVNVGAPAANVIESYASDRTLQLVNATVEIIPKQSDGPWAGASARLGRQYVYGSELAALDGASLTMERGKYSINLFGGRRFTYDSDPRQRGIGGANMIFRLGPDASLAYEGLWYIKGSNSLTFRKKLGSGSLISSYLRAYGGAPVDFNTQFSHTGRDGRTTLQLSFFEKLTNRDYFYDLNYAAADRDPHNPLPRLYLGPLTPFSQFVVDLERSVTSRVRAGGSVWFRRLTDARDQGPFDTSFEDYRAHVQFFPIRRTETSIVYHQRDSDRLSPAAPSLFGDVTTAGETSVKDITGELRRSFREGRFSLSAGAYYRRISMQNQFEIVNGAHQSGWLAGVWIKLDQHSRLYIDYNLDNDFFLFRPAIANSRVLRAGMSWKK